MDSFEMALKRVYIDLLVKHLALARDKDEEGRKRVFELIDDLEWVYPDRSFYV